MALAGQARGLTLLRHPSVAVPRGLCYGRTDVALAETAGAEIAEALAPLGPVSVVHASPAVRCRALAEALAARDRVALHLDPRLLELDFGTWEGRSWDRIDRAESDPWADDPWHRAPPGGETFAALHARVAEALAEAPDGAAIVTHAGPIRAAHMILTGPTMAEVFAEPVPYARPIHLSRAPLPWPT